MKKINRAIIKEQNLASKSGKYINKATALQRIEARVEEEKNKLLKGKS